MYRSSRSRGREKLHRAGGGVMAASDPKPFSADRKGHAQLKKRTSALKSALDFSRRSGSSMEENSVAHEFWRSSSKKVNGTPMRMLIDEEVSKDMETRHSSPSVIARLMGLDTLPPMMVHEQQKNMGSRFQTASSVGFQEKYASSEDHSHRSSTDEHQEFKDVFEVIEPSKVKSQKNKPVRKGMVSSEQNEADMDLIRQKFMEAKRLSTDEVLQNSNEFNDALEVLDSNKDLFLEFLQGPDSLFTMHLHDLKCAPPSSHASHITVLESSKGTKCQSSDVYFKSERNTGKFTHMRQEADSSFRKPATSLLSHSFKDYNDSLPKKLSKSRYVGKAEASVHPTRIVVLKPSLHKIQRMAEVALTDENFQLGNRRRSEFPLSGIQESYMEGRYHQRLSDNVEILGHNVKSSREIAREITKHMKRTVSCSNREVFTSGLNMYNRSQSSCIPSGMSKSNTSKTFHRICDHYDDWRNNFSPSSLYSAESSVSREARKHLSARWKKTHKFQEVGLVARGSSTLGEMLASSDREDTLDSLVIQKVPGKNLARDEKLGTSGCPLGISSKDGWKDGNSRKLPRSKSLPASSTVYGSPKLSNRNRVGGNNNCYMLKDVLNKGPEDSSDGNFCRRRRSLIRSSKNHSNKPRLSDSHGDENMLPEQDIHVNSEELRNSIHGKHLDENKLVRPAHSDDAVSDRKYLIESSMLPDCRDVMQLSITQEELVEQQIASTMLANNEGFSAHNQDDRVIEEQILGIQETSTEHPQVDSLISQYGAMESGSPVSSKECEQPSPISVLEPPSEEETSSSGCFERISAELQELRLQLQLLKLESADTYAEEPEVLILSDEDTGACCHSPLLKGSVLQAFRDDDDRDFSYLLDVLSESGVHGINQDRIFDAFYSPNSPVGPGVFDKLEKKYCVLVLWSRSERKLLFDLINIILVDLVAPCMDLHPWLVSKRCQPMWNHEGLAEGVWQMVVRQRKELAGNLEEVVLEQRWFSTEEYADMIGREIEKILNEDLLEELVADFSLG
ncbi:uncharacterized protein LOC103706730 isoform X1 [Phoenix dactylifera]|uniref:Uncharacterized protein LOC103706730 isoform X1 n=1 Tax=Phoenix dactylifera TaxID=42345 RepID=A0A8B7MTS4_PHODC|nr:uncharacterized protein LOC103706730 isoform X1 [Phoenix dactylifera]